VRVAAVHTAAAAQEAAVHTVAAQEAAVHTAVAVQEAAVHTVAALVAAGHTVAAQEEAAGHTEVADRTGAAGHIAAVVHTVVAVVVVVAAAWEVAGHIQTLPAVPLAAVPFRTEHHSHRSFLVDCPRQPKLLGSLSLLPSLVPVVVL
jgi:hypothetical protein